MSLFGQKPKGEEPVDREKEHWKDLRAGLKLQSIVNSKRMNEFNHPKIMDKKTCIITRHIGYKTMIPGVGQWKIITDLKDECWFCGQHILTLFVWSPRIGQLSQVKDNAVTKHFKTEFDKIKADEDFMPTFHQTPVLRADFTDWHEKPMREIIKYCRENDTSPPYFITELIDLGVVREECDEPFNKPLNEYEKGQVNSKLTDYYETSWSSVIIKIMQFKNPLVANAHALTTLTSKVDPSNQNYFHIDWVRPGRHTFCVEHT